MASLENITDVNRRKAWLFGNWDVVAGGAIDDVWNTDVHIVPRVQVPRRWRLERTFDWGSTHPFSCGIWAEANGEPVNLPDGTVKHFAPGSIIRIAELYGADMYNGERYGHNKGKMWSARKIAQEILNLEEELLQLDWIPSKPQPGPADGQIYGVNERESGSIADRMEDVGVSWYAADKRPGSRINGLQLFRDMLEASTRGEGAGFYVMDNCEAFLETAPTTP